MFFIKKYISTYIHNFSIFKNYEYRLQNKKKEYFKKQVLNEKELIKILIDIFYDEVTAYDRNERVAFETITENKRYIIAYEENDNDFVYKPTMQDFIKIME